ncbi:MAG: hypothetical protein ACTHOC_12715 [Luteimonas sp.]
MEFIDLYHCTRDATLADKPLATPSDAVLKGLFFSQDGAEDSFGPETYRAKVPYEAFLSQSMIFNMELAGEGGIDWALDAAGQPLHLTMDQLQLGVRQAMVELEIEPEHFDAVWECAIDDGACQENEQLEDEGIDGWTLQNVRGLAARNVGLAGAVMEDETGQSFMVCDTRIGLEKVELDEEVGEYVAIKQLPDRFQDRISIDERAKLPDLTDPAVLDQIKNQHHHSQLRGMRR